MGLDNPLHIAFLVVFLLLLFGAKRLPEIGRQLGSGMREFKDSVTGSGGASQSQQAALPQATQVAAPPAQAPAAPAQAAAPPAAPVTAPPAAPAPAAAPVAEPAPVEPSHQA
jgi:TatA/E family protein of Tat protein translocase